MGEGGEASVYAMDGRLLARIGLEKGRGRWEAKGMASGPYIVRVKTSGQVFQKKIILMR